MVHLSWLHVHGGSFLPGIWTWFTITDWKMVHANGSCIRLYQLLFAWKWCILIIFMYLWMKQEQKITTYLSNWMWIGIMLQQLSCYINFCCFCRCFFRFFSLSLGWWSIVFIMERKRFWSWNYSHGHAFCCKKTWFMGVTMIMWKAYCFALVLVHVFLNVKIVIELNVYVGIHKALLTSKNLLQNRENSTAMMLL